MSNFKLLFVVLVACALATASVNKNLRYLDDQNEREMDDNGSGSPVDGNESSSQTTPEATTTKDESTSQPSTPSSTPSSSSSSSTPDGGETITPGDVTTTKSSEEPLPTKFLCALEKANAFTDHKGYNLTSISCMIPKPTGEGIAEKPVLSIKNGKTDVDFASITPDDEGFYTATLTSSIEVLANHLTVTSNWSNVINTTELYLGCRLGNNYYIGGEKVEGDNVTCPAPLNTEITFNGTCVAHEDFDLVGTDKQYEFIFNEKSDICECAASVVVKDHTINLTTTDLSFGNTTKLPCKGPGEQTNIMCSVAGWVTTTSDEISSCTLDDGASVASISSFLFGIVVLIILTIF